MKKRACLAERAVSPSSAIAVIALAAVAVSVASSSSGQDKTSQGKAGMTAGKAAPDTAADSKKAKQVIVTTIPPDTATGNSFRRPTKQANSTTYEL
jgi:hypothetical protein